MNFKMVGHIIGLMLCIEALFMVPGAIICLWDGEPGVAVSYMLGVLIVIAAGVGMYLPCKNAKNIFYAQEAMMATGLGWIAMSALGCMPFVISGQIPSFVDAFFEMASGFSTTGASILTAPEDMSRGLLYWRSFSHWLGGMGVLVFVLAIVPKSGSGSAMHLLRAESPGPSVDKITARMRQSASLLYKIYLGLTVADFLCLLLAGMPVFEAFCHAVGTAGTGGFGVKNDSFASYTALQQNITTVFMVLFGVNFSLYYTCLFGKIKDVFKDEELRLYLAIVFGGTALIALNIRSMYSSWEEAIRHAAFQIGSIVSSTGFCTTDFDRWPMFSKTLLLVLMLFGAMAGSTGGGMKLARPLLLFKNLRRSIRKMMRPRSVEFVRVNGNTVQEGVLSNLNAYITAYCLIIIVSFLVLSLDGFSIETNLSAAVSCVNNIGPGLDAAGPTCNYAMFSPLSKLVLSFDMLFGRLEIFPLLVLLSRYTWSRET